MSPWIAAPILSTLAAGLTVQLWALRELLSILHDHKHNTTP